MVTMITKNDQHKEQVNTESANSNYVIKYRNVEMPLSSRKCMRDVLRDRPLPLSYLLQTPKLSRSNTDPIPMNDTTFQVKEITLVKISFRNRISLNSKRVL